MLDADPDVLASIEAMVEMSSRYRTVAELTPGR